MDHTRSNQLSMAILAMYHTTARHIGHCYNELLRSFAYRPHQIHAVRKCRVQRGVPQANAAAPPRVFSSSSGVCGSHPSGLGAPTREGTPKHATGTCACPSQLRASEFRLRGALACKAPSAPTPSATITCADVP